MAAKKESSIKGVFKGRWLSTRFLTKHWGLILAIMVLAMIYITNRYQCLTAMERIQALEKQLNTSNSERIRLKAEYMNSVREKTMLQLINDAGLDLVQRQQPPFKLKSSSQQ